MKTKILIVDDSSISRRIVRGFLESGGHEVCEASDGNSALERYSAEKPDLVLLDLVMAGMGGLEVLQKLREIDGHARVIIATADIQHSTREMARRAGSQGFLNKPFQKEELVIAVKSALEKIQSVTALHEHHAGALAELINIVFRLTATKLSEISGRRVLLEPPTVSSHPIAGLAESLAEFGTSELISVHQAFTGPFSGDAIMCVNTEGAVRLSSLFLEEHLQSQQLNTFSAEILTEIGNMLLGACLGVFGNLLQMHITFSVPELHRGSLQQFLGSLTNAAGEMRHAIVIDSSFNIPDRGDAGRMAIVLNVASLDRLTHAVDQWEGNAITAM
jgi:chemotaxis protein CheC